MALFSVTNRPDIGVPAAPVAPQTVAAPEAGSVTAALPSGQRQGPVPATGFAPPATGARTRNPQSGLETVIGEDERLAIPDAALDPWRRICQLDLIGPLGTFKGTGWLAGPGSVITAGHCVHYATFFGGWATQITVSAGRGGDVHPFGQLTSAHFSTLNVWVDGQSADHDIACIHLDQPLGHKTGIFPCAIVDDAGLVGRRVNISGYPTDKDLAKVQYHHANQIMAVTARRLFYEIDTVSGQSGAPVWIQDSADTPPVCVGLHAYGVPGTPADLHIVANSAPRFDKEVLGIVSQWVAEDCARLGLVPPP